MMMILMLDDYDDDHVGDDDDHGLNVGLCSYVCLIRRVCAPERLCEARVGTRAQDIKPDLK